MGDDEGHWLSSLAMFGYAAFNSGLWWGLAFGAMWTLLLAACLWFYGVLPLHRETGDESE